MPLRGGSGLRQIRTNPQSEPGVIDVGRLLGYRKGLDPTSQTDLMQIESVAKGYVSGAYDDDQIDSFIEQNPEAATLIAPIVEQTRRRKGITSKYFNPGSREEVSLPRPEGVVGPSEVRVTPRKADLEGATLAALNSGDVEFATSLAGFSGKGAEGKNINSYNLALRAEGLQTDDDRINALSPEQASNALARTMPPTVVQTTGGSIVAPRGGVPGKPGGLPSFVENPKDLSPEAIKELSDVHSTAEQTAGLLSSFNDNYAGFKSSVVGEAVTAYKTRFGDDGMAGWWNEYQAKKNLKRNKLFGGALTQTEKTEWEKADIHPGMTPSLIKKNLARQAALEKRAAAKITKAYRMGSYNKAQIDAVAGSPNPTPAPTPIPAPTPLPKGWRISKVDK